MAQVGIVTVLYNSSSVLEDFFRSLDRQTCRDFTLYVVDNASPDDSVQRAEELAGSVAFDTLLISNPVNGGVAQGNNLGIRTALNDGCDKILLSNNDTVWQPDTLQILLEEAAKNNASLVVPRIVETATDLIWYGGGRWDHWRGGTRHDRTDRLKHPFPVSYAPTCCMLIDTKVFERTGAMDERFFIYYDDSDFVRRAAAHGYPVWYIPRTTIRHKESTSIGSASPLAQYWLSRNLLLFTHKHQPVIYWFYVLAVNLLILFTKRLITFGRGEWMASWRGMRDGIRICRTKQPKTTVQRAWKG